MAILAGGYPNQASPACPSLFGNSIELTSQDPLMLSGPAGSLPPEVLPQLLEHLGSSLAAALPSCRGVAGAALACDGSAFRPLALCVTAPSPGFPSMSSSQLMMPTERCSLVARRRRPGTSWQETARLLCCANASPCSWKEVTEVTSSGQLPSHRHSVAVCGAASEEEKVLLFGGNVSRTVAGAWRTSAELYLANLPLEPDAPVAMQCLSETASEASPCSRWGSTLTQTTSGAAILWGGWSRDGDTSVPWMLRLREAAADWSEVRDTVLPPSVAFHTSTSLPDGKRSAVVGGLGDGGSQAGVWIFDSSSELWMRASETGPACAGHSAALDVDSQRLVVCLGVRRERRASLLADDSFLSDACAFDLRMQRWDDSAWKNYAPPSDANGPCHAGQDEEPPLRPCARRNAAAAALGRQLVVSGGYSDERGSALADTWTLDMRTGTWSLLAAKGAPELEGHKAVMSGLDMFTFGGHLSPGSYPRRTMSVHMLSMGQTGQTSQHAADVSDAERSEDEGSNGESSDEEAPVRRIPVQLLLRLLAAQPGQEPDE